MRALSTPQLVLEPLVVGHAEAMFDVLADPAIYDYLDYPAPPSVEHLRGVYEKLEARWSPDGSERWLNWIVRPHGQPPVGYVQATAFGPGSAWVAYVLGSRFWGRGYAHAATRAMLEHLSVEYDVGHFLATVEVDNQRSVRLLERLAFRPATKQEAAAQGLSPSERLFLRSADFA